MASGKNVSTVGNPSESFSQPIIETLRSDAVYSGFAIFKNVRRYLLHTPNVADLLPITAGWAGQSYKTFGANDQEEPDVQVEPKGVEAFVAAYNGEKTGKKRFTVQLSAIEAEPKAMPQSRREGAIPGESRTIAAH